MTKEYIERGALIETLRGSALAKYPASFAMGLIAAADEAINQPAADVVEVKHGEWLDPIWDSDWHSMTATCSHCRERGEVRVKRNLQNILVIDSPRCPVCGAFMRGHGGADNG